MDSKRTTPENMPMGSSTSHNEVPNMAGSLGGAKKADLKKGYSLAEEPLPQPFELMDFDTF